MWKRIIKRTRRHFRPKNRNWYWSVLRIVALWAVGIIALHWWVIGPLEKPGFEAAPGYFGALAGSFLGLVAILAGALYNAHLTRKRDNVLILEELTGLLTALELQFRLQANTFGTIGTQLNTSITQGNTSQGTIATIADMIPPQSSLLNTDASLHLIGKYVAGSAREAIVNYVHRMEIVWVFRGPFGLSRQQNVAWTPSAQAQQTARQLIQIIRNAEDACNTAASEMSELHQDVLYKLGWD